LTCGPDRILLLGLRLVLLGRLDALVDPAEIEEQAAVVRIAVVLLGDAGAVENLERLAQSAGGGEQVCRAIDQDATAAGL
jgi:hypothetical protein